MVVEYFLGPPPDTCLLLKYLRRASMCPKFNIIIIFIIIHFLLTTITTVLFPRGHHVSPMLRSKASRTEWTDTAMDTQQMNLFPLLVEELWPRSVHTPRE